MQIGSNSLSTFISQFTGSDTSSQRIKKAIDAAGNSPFELTLKQSVPVNSSNSQSSATTSTSWGNVFLNLGAADGAIHIEDMVKVADVAIKDAKNQLDSAFASAGIRNSPPVNFSIDQQGQLVIGDHPQREQIQKLLNENSSLTENVREAMILKEQAVSWQKAANFTEAYQHTYSQKGAAAAFALLERYMSLGDAKSSFNYSASGFTGLFNGKPEQEYLASIMNALGVDNGLRVDSLV
ncbi:MAG: hypothetical protein EBS53_09365 [Bacteroidetes bacterium]|nr:hypothetical protein [Bacteroidota bacterium]